MSLLVILLCFSEMSLQVFCFFPLKDIFCILVILCLQSFCILLMEL